MNHHGTYSTRRPNGPGLHVPAPTTEPTVQSCRADLRGALTRLSAAQEEDRAAWTEAGYALGFLLRARAAQRWVELRGRLKQRVWELVTGDASAPPAPDGWER